MKITKNLGMVQNSTLKKKFNEQHLDLLTPYFQRSIHSQFDTRIVKTEAKIEEWLNARDIRLVTVENIHYERKFQRFPSIDTEEADPKPCLFSSISSPCKEESSFDLLNNSLFMRRKFSSIQKDA